MEAVDNYIDQFDGEAKGRLQSIRKMVLDEVPDAEEGISYGLVGYKLNGKPLIYFGAYAHHIGLYATPQAHKEFAKELSAYKQGRGSVHFPLDKPMPLDLIKKIILFNKTRLLDDAKTPNRSYRSTNL